jgi:hypothetical protein
MVEIGTFLYLLQIPFLLVFLGALFGVLRRAEGGSGALSASVLGAGIAMVVIASMGALISSLTPSIGHFGRGGGDRQGYRRHDAAGVCLERLPASCAPGSYLDSDIGEWDSCALDRVGWARSRPDQPRLDGDAGSPGTVPVSGARDAAVRGLGPSP